MNRLVDHAYAEAIVEAMTMVPAPIMDRLRHVEFLTGTDPVWAGLHRFEEMSFGRSYRSTMHYVGRHHSADRTQTIVIPEPEEPFRIVHELGHALDEILGWSHDAQPITPYAGTDRFEAFAEAFTGWLYWYGDQDVFMADLATRSLLDGLLA